MQSKLAARTLELVRERPKGLRLHQIATETGVNLNWLYAFSSGQYTSPSIENVERLYTYLAGKSLDLS